MFQMSQIWAVCSAQSSSFCCFCDCGPCRETHSCTCRWHRSAGRGVASATAPACILKRSVSTATLVPVSPRCLSLSVFLYTESEVTSAQVPFHPTAPQLKTEPALMQATGVKYSSWSGIRRLLKNNNQPILCLEKLY